LSWIQSPEFSGRNLSPERIGDLGVRSFTDSDTTSTWRPEGSKRRSSSSIRSSFSYWHFLLARLNFLHG
jgi:hypothetical protein